MESRRTTADTDDLYGSDSAGHGAQPPPPPPDPDPPQPPPPPRDPDPPALFILLDALRLAAPADLQDRLTALIREALLTLRTLIDRYLERIDQTPTERKVENIPID